MNCSCNGQGLNPEDQIRELLCEIRSLVDICRFLKLISDRDTCQIGLLCDTFQEGGRQQKRRLSGRIKGW